MKETPCFFDCAQCGGCRVRRQPPAVRGANKRLAWGRELNKPGITVLWIPAPKGSSTFAGMTARGGDVKMAFPQQELINRFCQKFVGANLVGSDFLRASLGLDDSCQVIGFFRSRQGLMDTFFRLGEVSFFSFDAGFCK